ncbi:hypothetical protein LVD17_03720 [Fulvivirga ulvae]|uniref:YybH family protein n=1 Tax=Fulvivirga ulvae TaxID=2904245 RepID=UPI001F23D694|nr:hypothetical protein [Fulvivirga ulvae]UII32936.1 hypothetical protein LVD17_03720 [Fulvivirga ulvae]
MKTFSKHVLITFMALLWVCCSEGVETDKQQLADADIAFANMARQEGVGTAFIAYADSNAIIMQNDQLPLKGITDIAKVYAKVPADLMLTWYPEKAEIADSGDLGYTFGKYTLKHQSTTESGHYVTIWKKNKSGKWKYVLDTGTKNPEADTTSH